jgi:hypothetical protein
MIQFNKAIIGVLVLVQLCYDSQDPSESTYLEENYAEPPDSRDECKF